VVFVDIVSANVSNLLFTSWIYIPKIVAPACNDGVKNGDEEGIDCGIACKKNCNGKKCQKGADCWSGVCDSKKICAGKW